MTLKTVRRNAVIALPGVIGWIIFVLITHSLGWMDGLPIWAHVLGQAWGACMGLLLLLGVVAPIFASYTASLTPGDQRDRPHNAGLRLLTSFFAISDWKGRT